MRNIFDAYDAVFDIINILVNSYIVAEMNLSLWFNMQHFILRLLSYSNWFWHRSCSSKVKGRLLWGTTTTRGDIPWTRAAAWLDRNGELGGKRRTTGVGVDQTPWWFDGTRGEMIKDIPFKVIWACSRKNLVWCAFYLFDAFGSRDIGYIWWPTRGKRRQICRDRKLHLLLFFFFGNCSLLCSILFAFLFRDDAGIYCNNS